MTTENKEEQSIKPGYIDLLNSPDYYHHIEATTNKKQLRLDNADHLIITGVSVNKRKPITTVLHCMIGQSVKCWEERHEFVINTLLNEVLALRHIVGLYRERYGRLPVVKKGSSLQY